MRRFSLTLIAAGLLLSLLACGANDTFSPTVNGTSTTSGTFNLTVSPAANTVTVGNIATYTATVTSVSGFNSPVALSVTGVPSGASATFNPTSVTPTPSGANSTLTVNTGGGVNGTIRSRGQVVGIQPGAYTLTVTGTGGGITKQALVDLHINAVGTE